MTGLGIYGTFMHLNTTQPWKEKHHAICSNMDAARDYHTKWNKSVRERQIPYDITYTWNIKHGTNEPVNIYETETDAQM